MDIKLNQEAMDNMDMKLYLVQHGLAMSKKESPERPLSEKGREQTEAMGKYLANTDLLDIDCIYHSNKLRAIQTAEILAEHFEPVSGRKQSVGLGPNDDPDIFHDIVTMSGLNIMVVGHLPYLQRFTSLILTGSTENIPVKFTNSGIVCIEKKDGIWSVTWHVTPDLLNN